MFSTLLMGGGGHAREKDHQIVKSLIIFARDCRVANERIKTMRNILYDVAGLTFLNLRATRQAPHMMENTNMKLLGNLK